MSMHIPLRVWRSQELEERLMGLWSRPGGLGEAAIHLERLQESIFTAMKWWRGCGGGAIGGIARSMVKA